MAKTVLDALKHYVRLMNNAKLSFGHSTGCCAEEDAGYLIKHVLKLHQSGTREDSLDISQHYSRPLSNDERELLAKAFDKRVRLKYPSAMIVGEAFLDGCKFKVTKDVIIPRSHIAELLRFQKDDFEESKNHSTNGKLELSPFPPPSGVEILCKHLHRKKIEKIVDVGTGTGCLAILLARTFPLCKEIYALDISQQCLEVAAVNVQNYTLTNRIKLVHSNLFDSLDPKVKLPEDFDLIVSNPPYVEKSAMESLPMEYRHEPQLALYGKGMNGLEIVYNLIQQSKKYLSPSGILIVECPRKKEVEKLAAKTKDFPKIEWLPVWGGNDLVFFTKKEWM